MHVRRHRLREARTPERATDTRHRGGRHTKGRRRADRGRRHCIVYPYPASPSRPAPKSPPTSQRRVPTLPPTSRRAHITSENFFLAGARGGGPGWGMMSGAGRWARSCPSSGGPGAPAARASRSRPSTVVSLCPIPRTVPNGRRRGPEAPAAPSTGASGAEVTARVRGRAYTRRHARETCDCAPTARDTVRRDVCAAPRDAGRRGVSVKAPHTKTRRLGAGAAHQDAVSRCRRETAARCAGPRGVGRETSACRRGPCVFAGAGRCETSRRTSYLSRHCSGETAGRSRWGCAEAVEVVEARVEVLEVRTTAGAGRRWSAGAGRVLVWLGNRGREWVVPVPGWAGRWSSRAVQPTCLLGLGGLEWQHCMQYSPLLVSSGSIVAG
jgi:hypothetical protein